MQISITGGAGFIGRQLAQALTLDGHRVRVLTRQLPQQHIVDGIEYVQGNLVDGSNLLAFVQDAELLFHCAGEITDESRMHGLHVQGTQNLINTSTGKIRRWVQLSSTGAYGLRRAGSVLETEPLVPMNIYEKTKAASDELVLNAANQGAFSCSVLRPSIVYGAGMPNQSLYAMLRIIEKRLFSFIGYPGSSANYIHVDNVVEALLQCGFHANATGQVFNLSDHRTIEDFVGLMSVQMGVSVPKLRLPEKPTRWIAGVMQAVPGWPLTLSRVDALTSFVTYPTTKIERLIAYRHKISMDDGIADLVRDYRQRRL